MPKPMPPRNHGRPLKGMPQAPDTTAIIERINELTRTARGVWFGMLSYLAFVGVTLMGVRDVDFFLTERETQLPLIGVPVPTFLFFSLAPLLGAILYAYFHLHLLKMWEVLIRAPATVDGEPLSDHIAPWLVSDFALAYRTGALRDRPLRRLSHWVNVGLVFWGMPFVLGAFWYRSTPPHYEWLTILACGVPLTAAVWIGSISWWRMRQLSDGTNGTDFVLRRRAKYTLVAMAIGIAAIGWFRVEGTLRFYLADLGVPEEQLDASWYGKTPFPDFISAADLRNVNFSKTPEGWESREQFRASYRKTWCKEVGIPAGACGRATSTIREAINLNVLKLERIKYCSGLPIDSVKASPSRTLDHSCEKIFREYDSAFEAEWLMRRELQETKLVAFDFIDSDLRRANFSGAYLQYADLSGANLQYATLSDANMLRAVLNNSDMKHAKLFNATLFGTTMGHADLRNAYLGFADLRQAFLIHAKLQKATLSYADLRGAVLDSASLQQTKLDHSQLDPLTSLENTNFNGAGISEVDLSGVPLSFFQLSRMYGDGSVSLPSGHGPLHESWPTHWNKKILRFNDFDVAWRAFQVSIGQDPANPQ